MISSQSTRFTVGVDLGTSSAKAVLVDELGAIVASASKRQEVSSPRPGFYEQDALVQWWTVCVDLIRDVVGPLGDRVDAIAASGLGPCVLIGDDNGEPLRPPILYGIDTRATSEIAELHRRFGTSNIVARSGNVLSTQAAGPKLLWLARHEPEQMARARTVFSASSFLVHRLTGEYVLDRHTASQFDPLYDLTRQSWNDEWWEEICPGVRPPRLLWPGEVAGELPRSVARSLGLRAGVPVMAGTVDAWAEAASVDVRLPGGLMLMYGTTMFLIAMTADRVRSPSLWTTEGLEPGVSSLAGGMATSGALATWWAGVSGSRTVESVFADATRVQPGSDGLVVLPYFAGERTPIADPDARGMFVGLTLQHGRHHMSRALLEATAYAVRHNLEAYAEAGTVISRVVVAGGGAQSEVWLQIVSDVTGVSQVVPTITVGAAYGDARLAADAIGWDTSRWNPDRGLVAAREEVRDVYDRAYGHYRALYESTTEIVHDMARSTVAYSGQ
jgi:xylulokinase